MQLDTNNSPAFLGLNNENKGLREEARAARQGRHHRRDRHRHRAGAPEPRRHRLRPAAGALGRHLPGGRGLLRDRLQQQADRRALFRRRLLARTPFGDRRAGEFVSPRDSDGHGTHTATTAAGDETYRIACRRAGRQGQRHGARGRISRSTRPAGQAIDPDLTGCYFSDTAAAADAAVADGVDVISFSVGTAFRLRRPDGHRVPVCRQCGRLRFPLGGQRRPRPGDDGRRRALGHDGRGLDDQRPLRLRTRRGSIRPPPSPATIPRSRARSRSRCRRPGRSPTTWSRQTRSTPARRCACWIHRRQIGADRHAATCDFRRQARRMRWMRARAQFSCIPVSRRENPKTVMGGDADAMTLRFRA